MLKQIFIVLILYCISWWVLYSIYYKFANNNSNKDYTKDGLYGYIISFIYFSIFGFFCICVSNFKLSYFSMSKLTGISKSNSETGLQTPMN